MGEGSTYQYRILVVDDEPDILEIIEFNLQAQGYEVITAKNGDEAFEKAKKSLPDLVILDTDSGPNAIAELPDVLAGYKNGRKVFERQRPTLFPPS